VTVDLGLGGRAAIVTGASRGIGRAIAELLAAQGIDVCLVAAPRDAQEFEAAAASVERQGVRALAMAADVGLPETA
jgi:NAD(P)-dependent dehydrogenase (short-subunit alcohol dehydrogenase family)